MYAKIWWFWVKRCLKFATRSLCDGRRRWRRNDELQQIEHWANGIRHKMMTILVCLALMWCQCRSFVRSSQSEQSYISRNGWHRITKFYKSIHTGRVYNHTGYDITSYFLSEVTDVRNMAEMTPPTASTWNQQIWYKHPYYCIEHPYRIWRH